MTWPDAYDGVPILEALERCDARFAQKWWHWFLFAQLEKPERAIMVDPDGRYGGSPEAMGADAYSDFRAAIHDPFTVHGMIEDYRARLGIDRAHVEHHRREGCRVACPTLVLWSLKDDLESLYGNVLGVWAPWITSLQDQGIACGHHMAEEAPLELAAKLISFPWGARRSA